MLGAFFLLFELFASLSSVWRGYRFWFGNQTATYMILSDKILADKTSKNLNCCRKICPPIFFRCFFFLLRVTHNDDLFWLQSLYLPSLYWYCIDFFNYKKVTVAAVPAIPPPHTPRPTRDRSRRPHHSGTEVAVILPTLQPQQEPREVLGR